MRDKHTLVAQEDPEIADLYPLEIPEYIVTEDDEPVDSPFSAKQQRLLVDPLQVSWVLTQRRRFIADANIGVFYRLDYVPLVPDAFISMDVEWPEDIWTKGNRAYFVWLRGKPPDVVVEIVSNRKGNEAGSKMTDYATLGALYYALFDPENHLRNGMLHFYQLVDGAYVERDSTWMPEVGLGLALWQGAYEGREELWLRWCDQDGNVLQTGFERSTDQQQRADAEQQRADTERQRADTERQRAEQQQQRADTEQQRADAERQRADAERQRAEQQQQRADTEQQRADAERQRAEQQQQRADAERQRAEQQQQRAEWLAAQLRALGIDPDSDQE